MIETRSKFYYDYTVDETKNKFDFNEGAGQVTATLSSGYYTLTSILTEIARAMNQVGTKKYSCSVDRSTRKITISTIDATNFSLLINTGTNKFTSIFETIGFTGLDRINLPSHVSNIASGKEFRPQFKLQNYVDFADWIQASQATVRKTANGQVEVVKFGTESFSEFDIKYQNNYSNVMDSPIEVDLNGVNNLRNFMTYAITKGPFEFMPDRDNSGVFYQVILESTGDSSDGVGFKLKEQKVKGFFDTGIIKIRRV